MSSPNDNTQNKKNTQPKNNQNIKKKKKKKTKKEQRTGRTKKTDSKTVDSNFTKSMSTLNIPAKSQRLSERVKNLDPIVYCLRDTFRNKYIKRKPTE